MMARACALLLLALASALDPPPEVVFVSASFKPGMVERILGLAAQLRAIPADAARVRVVAVTIGYHSKDAKGMLRCAAAPAANASAGGALVDEVLDLDDVVAADLRGSSGGPAHDAVPRGNRSSSRTSPRAPAADVVDQRGAMPPPGDPRRGSPGARRAPPRGGFVSDQTATVGELTHPKAVAFVANTRLRAGAFLGTRRSRTNGAEAGGAARGARAAAAGRAAARNARRARRARPAALARRRAARAVGAVRARRRGICPPESRAPPPRRAGAAHAAQHRRRPRRARPKRSCWSTCCGCPRSSPRRRGSAGCCAPRTPARGRRG